MKSRRTNAGLRAGVLAVQGALGLMLAPAHAEPTLEELTQLHSTIALGVDATVRGAWSARGMEYAGRRDDRPYVFGHVDLRGGAAWDGPDTLRWSLTGSDLGTRSPALVAELNDAGRWRVRLGYEQLWRNLSDSFRSPYLGVGSDRLVMSPGWVPPVSSATSATATNARGLDPALPATAASARIRDGDLSLFQRVDLGVRRERYGIDVDRPIDRRWSVGASLSHEHKDGVKAQPAHTDVGGDFTVTLPTAVDQDDDQWRLALAYTAPGLQAQFAYEGSSFRNNLGGTTWDYWATTTNARLVAPYTQRAAPFAPFSSSVAPGNLFQKLSFSGSWQAAPSTRLLGDAGWSRSTQNEPFLLDGWTAATTALVPATSARAEVVGQTLGLKLLHQALPRLDLAAAYRYELHDNRTPVATYLYYDNVFGPAPTPGNANASPFAALFPNATQYLASNVNINANTPYSRRSHRIDLDADLRLDGGQRLRGGLRAERGERWCNGSWINCADAPTSREATLHVDWSGTLAEDLAARVGLVAARRRVDYDENAFLAVVPMAGVSGFAVGPLAGSTALQALTALGLTGYGPVAGFAANAGDLQGTYFPNNNVLLPALYGNRNRISELIGLRRYDQADRDRTRLRSSLDWQAGERLSLQAGLDLADDHYARSVYGLQRLRSGALNVDGTWQAARDLSLNLFATWEASRTTTAGNTYTANSAVANVNGATAVQGGCFDTLLLRNRSNKIDPCLDWTADTRDTTGTLGARLARQGLLGGRLDVSASALLSQARTAIGVRGGAYVNNPTAGVGGDNVAAIYVPATALPVNRVHIAEWRLGAAWRADPMQTVHLMFSHLRLSASDWGYEGLQPGGVAASLPTFEQPPAARIGRIAVMVVTTLR